MKATLEVINEMQAKGVIGKYAIGGAVGATFYLEPAATFDVDIFVVLPWTQTGTLLSLSPIYGFLKARGCHIGGEHIIIGTWPVRFLPASDGLEREALEHPVQTEVEGVETWVMTAEHLVAIALRTGRPKDHARILQFLEADAIDREALRGFLIRHGLLRKWEQFQEKYLEK
jgi:hypothetical protein